MAQRLLQVDIELDAQAFNTAEPEKHIEGGEAFGYQINENSEPLGYDNNTALVNKSFVSDVEKTVSGIFTIKNRVVQNLIGSFNHSDSITTVDAIEYFHYKEDDIYLIAIGGSFDTYTLNGVITNCRSFIILNLDFTVFAGVDYLNLIQSLYGEVKDIKYHELNNSLIIGGGLFEGVGPLDDLDNLFELDLNTLELSSSMAQFSSEGSVDKPVFAIDIINAIGVIIIGGQFSNVIGISANRLFGLNSNFETGTKSFFTKIRTEINDVELSFVEKILIKQEGVFQVLCGGSFETDNRENLVVFDGRGDVIEGFKSCNERVRDIVEADAGYFIAGNFTLYGNETVNRIIKPEYNGFINFRLGDPFVFDLDVLGVGRISVDENNILYISFFSQTLDYNFGRLSTNTGVVSDRLTINGNVQAISKIPDNNSLTSDIIIGGFITSVEEPTTDLNQNEILLDNSSVSITRDNLFANLVAENSRNQDLGFQYIKIDSNKIRISKIIESENDEYSLTNITNLVNKITVVVFRNDGNLGTNIINIPIRKDYFIKNLGRDIWSTANFSISFYNNYLATEQTNIDIVKSRISEDQFYQFINLSPLVNQQELEADMAYYNQLDYSTTAPTIKDAFLGRFVFIRSETFLNENLLVSSNQFSFILDGYREAKPVLLNGNKRKFNSDNKFTIPFISDKIKEIEIIQGSTSSIIANPNFQNVDAEKPQQYISYLCIDFSEYLTNNKTKLLFKNNDSTLETITLFKGTESCLFYSVKVIFKNSFGALEPTYMNGRSIDSVDTDSSKYKRSIRDINGNIQLPLTHTNKIFNKIGSREWECNTGLVDAYMNDCYEDLFMSEEIWLEIDGVLRAVSLESSNFNKEDDLQTDMINYRFTFKEDRNLNE